MKIVYKNNPIEFEKIKQGQAFYYGSVKTLCMKVSTIEEYNSYLNAVELGPGILIKIEKSEIVTPASVHIEGD